MSVTTVMRQSHRWLSAIFMLAVVVTSVALSQEKPEPYMSYLPLPPLFLMMITGVYLFVQPYWLKFRRRA
jgi:membrane protein CcdC involved in cytochrome C biogenesis